MTLNDIRWWTGMPTPLMVGGSIVQVRARGTATLDIIDATQFAARCPDQTDLANTLPPSIALGALEALGELSRQVANVRQLTTVTPQTVAAVTANINGKLVDFGLRVKTLNIEAVDQV